MQQYRLRSATPTQQAYRFLSVSFLAFISAVGLAQQSTPDPALTEQVKNVLEKNPEIVYDALVSYQKQQEAKKIQAVKKYMNDNTKSLFFDKADGVLGNPKAKTTLLIINDYGCGYCKKSRLIIDEIVKDNKDLRIVIKQLPVLGPGSVYAAKAATLAQKKKKFTVFDSKLSSMERPITEEKVKKAMQQSGLDPKEIDAQKQSLEAVINSNYVHAQKLMIRGTPALIIYSPPTSQAEFIDNVIDKKAIEEKIKEHQDQMSS